MTKTPQWQPQASLKNLTLRANSVQKIRDFFRQRGVLEVETPQWLTSVAPELHQDPIACCQGGFLHSSPETSMKRLLAAGSGPIYQICRAFRADELGRYHNPEFTMLEWYRPGWSYKKLMKEVEKLVVELLAPTEKTLYLTYRQAFLQYANVDPFVDREDTLLRALQENPPNNLDREGMLDLLLTQRLETALKKRGGMVFLYDYPPHAAAMAQIDSGITPVARRFELYLEGVELANGYQELTDAKEQRNRLLKTNEQRHLLGKSPLPIDENFMQAMYHGLPDCSGVALGLDRLIMVLAGVDTIGEVMAFPFDRI